MVSVVACALNAIETHFRCFTIQLFISFIWGIAREEKSSDRWPPFEETISCRLRALLLLFLIIYLPFFNNSNMHLAYDKTIVSNYVEKQNLWIYSIRNFDLWCNHYVISITINNKKYIILGIRFYIWAYSCMI